MVYQYRHPLGRRLWELPAGLLDIDGEPPHRHRRPRTEGGGRACRAATGGCWSTSISTPGFSDECVRVYLATGLTEVDRPEAHDEEADLTVQWFPLDEAVRMVLSGEIVNSIAVAGILAATRCATEIRRAASGRRAVARPADRVRARRQGNSAVTTFRPALDDQLQGYLDHLTIERGVAANTLSSYRRDLRRYPEHLDRCAASTTWPRSPRPTSASSWWRCAAATPTPARSPLSAVSAARALIAVRGLHRFAAAEGLTDLDVARAVKPPTPSRRLPKSLTIDEVLALLEGAGGDSPADGPLTLRNRALLELLYSTGARISEAVGLDVDDVDTQARSVLLRGKGGKQRLVPIGRPAVTALDAYLVRGRPDLARRGRGTPAIFLNARGGRLSRQSAWQVLQDAAERAGITAAVSPHTLRHSFATHLLDGGADVRVVQELLGHASVTTTQIYTLVTVHALREVWAGAHPRAR